MNVPKTDSATLDSCKNTTRRNLLIGLVGASAAAAVVGSTAVAETPIQPENPELHRLAAELPEIEARYVAADNKEHAFETAYGPRADLVRPEEYEALWPVTSAAAEALEAHVAAIMKQPDFTMDGLIIKAQALAAWGRVRGTRKVSFRHGLDWPEQISESILRHIA